MKNRVSDHDLDKNLRTYMSSGAEQAFSLDEKRVFKKPDKQRNTWVLKKAPALVVAMLILVVSVMTVPSVRAAIGRLFTFIPGVGIVEQSDSMIYAMNPITKKIEIDSGSGNARVDAYLENAIYSNGYLNISIIINGKHVDFKDFTLYVNGESKEYDSMGWSAWGAEYTTCHTMWLKTQEPKTDNLYEIEIVGFPRQLSFTLDTCSEYDDLAKIGPTDTKNDIAVTTTASREESRLTAWCYPLNTTNDKITGIGSPYPSIWKNEAYIETENGFKSVYNASGARITERFIFDIPVGDISATLHIPYLTLVRDEKKKVTVPIPSEYGVVGCDIPVDFSLGTVKITEVERKPDEYGGEKDTLRISFTFDSADSNTVFNSFRLLDAKNNPLSHMSSYNDETGCLEFIETEISVNAAKMTFTVSDLCYYLLGEYVIPLEIK